MHSLMHPGCSGTQHEDCVKLLQRLQAAADQPITSSSSANSAAAASHIADAACKLPQDWVDASSWSLPASKSLLAIQYIEMQGRQLAVSQDTAAGAVLWREKPFVHLLLKQHRKQVWHVLLADRDTAVHCCSASFNVIVMTARAPVSPQSWHTILTQAFATLHYTLSDYSALVQAAKDCQQVSKLTKLCYCRNAVVAWSQCLTTRITPAKHVP